VGLSTWLDRWVRLEHHQPAVVEDEQTGEWRGATKAEYEQWRRELDRLVTHALFGANANIRS
jgi:hypothetical protein